MRREIHVGGELVGQAANLAPAHGIGLTGDGEGAHPGPADAPGGQVTVDDGIGLVGPERPLVDPLAVEGDAAFGAGEGTVELRDLGLRQAAARGHGGDGCGLAPGLGEGGGEPLRMGLQEVPVQGILAPQVVQQAVEQEGVGTRGQGQVQVGVLAGRRPPWVQDHHLEPGALPPRLADALVDHRVAPGGVGAHQDDQVRKLQVP